VEAKRFRRTAILVESQLLKTSSPKVGHLIPTSTPTIKPIVGVSRFELEEGKV